MAPTCFRTRTLTARASSRNGSTRSASRAGSSGASRRLRPSVSRLMPGRAILSQHEDMVRVAAEVAPITRGDAGAPVCREPWEAQAFGMTLALYEQGLFTWTEWAAALSDAIKRAQGAGDCDDGST